jgi:hypothetical protein
VHVGQHLAGEVFRFLDPDYGIERDFGKRRRRGRRGAHVSALGCGMLRGELVRRISSWRAARPVNRGREPETEAVR